VAIVNESLARRYWPVDDAIGQRIVLSDHWAASSSTIIGIVSDVRASAVDKPAAPTVYVPWGEIPGFRLAVGLRTRADAGAVAPALRDRIRRLDSQMIVSNVRTLDEVVSGAVSKPRFHLVLVASFAVLALALAAVGIYGVIAYLVSRRTREIGIRMALGARRGDVLRLVLGEGLRPVVLGVLAGAVVSAGTVRLLRTLLFGIAPLDPISFALAAMTMIVAATVAALLPARRAATIDPLVALRDE
jgi:predicted lysophospholipase L1 biosynthesis ABC-type transport system permease subunit